MMTRFDWLFVITFYIAGMILIPWGFSTKYTGAGLFGAITGFVFVLTASYHIKLEEYR